MCGGIGLAELWVAPGWAIGVLAALAMVATPWRRVRWLTVLCLGLSLGLWRWSVATSLPTNSVARLAGQTVTITGDVLTLPVNTDSQIIILDHIHHGRQSWTGTLSVSTARFPSYRVGQRLTVQCQPEAFPPAQRWRQWSRGVVARCFQAKVLSVTAAPDSWRLRLVRIEMAVVAFIQRSFNEPQASLLTGIMLGYQVGMPVELTRAFQATGTTHIIALSGFNVTIIVSAVGLSFVRLIGRRWAWVPSLLLVIAFVVMTGASASVVRAAIMASLSLLGIFLGRPIHPARLLALTALTMLLVNPLILWHDLGFQLSFLATAGLMFAAPPLAARLTWIAERWGLRENLATTLGAILATEPLLLWRFGRLSLIAPVVNVVVVPMIPLAMALGGLSLVGLWLPALASPVVAVTDAWLRLIVWCITTGANVPAAQIFPPGAIVTLTAAAMAGLLLFIIQHHHDQENHPA